mgnify:CR=1 FL=1
MEKTTNVFTVLDEDKMMIAEQTIGLYNGFHKHVLPAIFETEKEAIESASKSKGSSSSTQTLTPNNAPNLPQRFRAPGSG